MKYDGKGRNQLAGRDIPTLFEVYNENKVKEMTTSIKKGEDQENGKAITFEEGILACIHSWGRHLSLCCLRCPSELVSYRH